MLYITVRNWIVLWNFVKRKKWRLTLTRWLHEEQKNQLKIAKKICEKGFESSAGIEFMASLGTIFSSDFYFSKVN
jgi:hypothetical protein